jgi:hypothetical protein
MDRVYSSSKPGQLKKEAMDERPNLVRAKSEAMDVHPNLVRMKKEAVDVHPKFVQ